MILCVDPDAESREATRAALADAGFEVRAAASQGEAVDALDADDPPDCLVTEHVLPDGNGVELIGRVRAETPDTACVLFTDDPLSEVDTEAFGDAVAEYLDKTVPDARAELAALVEQSLAFLSQTAYPLPDDEEARVAALERYTADPADLDGSLDRLTAIAVELFDVDSAAVGLIDAHHERFLSCHGVSFEAIEREDTVCTYAILDDDVTVVEDLRSDPRFSENASLLATGIRFYAGAPLLTPEGRAIGTFCVHDDAARSFPARDRDLLSKLAAEAMDQLELRRRLMAAEGGDDG